ncbi:hypothetical protein [Ruegeria arenilitoris]|uniref:hypothetical protein n=1 Tax=Ruegeria arenilitoris TaxID=1173585 RepID=UPI001480A378|nr:hypothetical protein [Ruegeria arenilitoris]
MAPDERMDIGNPRQRHILIPKKQKALFEKRLTLIDRGILDGKVGEAKSQLKKAQEELHSPDASTDAISFDPATPKQFIRAIQGLVASTGNPA